MQKNKEISKKDLLFKKFSAKISFCTVEKLKPRQEISGGGVWFAEY